jgi:hypothetical protein
VVGEELGPCQARIVSSNPTEEKRGAGSWGWGGDALDGEKSAGWREIMKDSDVRAKRRERRREMLTPSAGKFCSCSRSWQKSAPRRTAVGGSIYQSPAPVVQTAEPSSVAVAKYVVKADVERVELNESKAVWE